MKRIAIVAALVALSTTLSTTTARADLKIPPGWQTNPEFAAAMSPRTDVFGGTPATVAVGVYRAPIRGAVLYVTRAEAKLAADKRDAAATYEIEELKRALERAGSSAKVQSQNQRVDSANKLLEATLVWRDEPAALVNSKRVVVAADATRVVAMTGECVLATDLDPAIGKACEDALVSLAPDIPADQRVALSIVQASPPVDAPTPSPSEPVPTGSATSSGPSMGDASKLPPLPPVVVAPTKTPQRETDRRPVILGLGLVVIAIVFYWNRKRREKFEREDARAASRDDRDDSDDSDDSGGDDDDLHAAARTPDDKGKKADDDAN